MKTGLEGRTCYVIGGTGGIGQEIVRGFEAAGGTVLVGSSSPARLDDAVKRLGAGRVVPVDVTDEESVAAAFDEVVARQECLDVVVNAAGMSLQKPTLDVQLSEWMRVLQVNLTGAFLVSRGAGKVMKRQEPNPAGERGCILHIASMASYTGLADVAAYGCSKAGVVQLTKSLANDWARYGIRVNAIAPGFFLTDLNRARMEGTPRGKWVLDHTPMGRFGEPEELVGAAVYLCGDAAGFTTGHVIVVDGGFLVRGIP